MLCEYVRVFEDSRVVNTFVINAEIEAIREFIRSLEYRIVELEN